MPTNGAAVLTKSTALGQVVKDLTDAAAKFNSQLTLYATAKTDLSALGVTVSDTVLDALTPIVY